MRRLSIFCKNAGNHSIAAVALSPKPACAQKTVGSVCFVRAIDACLHPQDGQGYSQKK
jgi:hypothetical protein